MQYESNQYDSKAYTTRLSEPTTMKTHSRLDKSNSIYSSIFTIKGGGLRTVTKPFQLGE